MKKIELLAPAGNFECEVQAINNGANAIYLGGSLFSARAFADNFDVDEVKKAIEYAHLRNVKVYITINTLLNELEIEKAYDLAKIYYDLNVDAILVQDLGLLSLLRERLPDLEVHASTQMHIHNIAGINACKQIGIKRVVVARESSLDFIKEACKQGVEIETFVHGAICVSYSGECLMSSLTKKRSANKGMCAQCCRLKYDLYENDKLINCDTKYLLSPKDMFLLQDIPSLIEAGVSSLKIEGRMKSSAYVGYVTRLYREAIDTYYNGEEFVLTQEKMDKLKVLFNRGFSNTYLKNDNAILFHNKRPNHMGILIGKVIKTQGLKTFIKLDRDIEQFSGIRVINNNEDAGLILNSLLVKGKLVAKAYRNEVIEVNLKTAVKINDEVYLTQDNKFETEINNSESLKLPLSLKIEAYAGTKLKVVADDFIYQSDLILDKALKRPISKENIIDCFSHTDIHPYELKELTIEMDDFFIPLKMLNEIRRNFYDVYDLYRLNSFKRIANPYYLKPLKEVDNSNMVLSQYAYKQQDDYYFSDIVNLDSKYAHDNNVVSDLGGLFLEGNKIAYYSLNVSNSYAYEFLLRHGFKNVILSLELSEEMIDYLVEGFKNRMGFDIKPLIFVYGKRDLMHILRDPFKDYIKNYDKAYLSDGTNKYRLIKRRTCLDIIEYETYTLNNNKYSKFYKYNYPEEIGNKA